MLVAVAILLTRKIPPAKLAFGNRTVAPNEKSQSGQTRSPGGAITVSRSGISLQAGGSKVIVGGSLTQDIQRPARPTPMPRAALIFGTDTIARYTVNGQTVSPGSAISKASEAISSLKPDGSEAVEMVGASSVKQTLANIPGPTPSSFGATLESNNVQYLHVFF